MADVDPRDTARIWAFVLLPCAATAFGMWQRDVAAGVFVLCAVGWFTAWLKS